MTPTLRFSILRRDGYTCQYCGKKGNETQLEVDHIDPKANNGPDIKENLVTACGPCNRGKRDKLGILPPPQITEPVPYPVGMFFNVHRYALGLPDLPRSENIAWQGWVISVQGDEVWCQTFNGDGDEGFIKAFPRNGWVGWDFFQTSYEMRYQCTVEMHQAGLVPWADVERFEEFDASRFNDNKRLDAFYKSHPQWKPSWWPRK
jgi:hypothetical protein